MPFVSPDNGRFTHSAGYVGDGVVNYWHHVLSTDIISEVTSDDIDIEFTKQYANYFDTPWKNSISLIEQFKNSNKDILSTYLTEKCVASLAQSLTYCRYILCRDLTDVIDPMDSRKSIGYSRDIFRDKSFDDNDSIVRIPLDHVTISQIEAFANNCYSRYKSTNVSDDLTELNLLATVIRAHRASYDGEVKALSINEGGYVTSETVARMCDFASRVLEDFRSDAQNNPKNNIKIKLANCMVSLLLSLFVMLGYTRQIEITEDRFFRDRIMSASFSNKAGKIISFVRRYSGLNPSTALMMPMTPASIVYGDSPINKAAGLNPYSLVEKYLLYYTYTKLNEYDRILDNDKNNNARDLSC